MSDAVVALKWITEILQKHSVPFVVTGGLAARAYGAMRPLHDIDIDIPDNRFSDILRDVQSSIVSGPERHVDEHWDLFLMTLEYRGMSIDISGADTAKAYDRESHSWSPCPTDLSHGEMRKVMDLEVPVIAKADLIRYKRLVGRDVDLLDLGEIV